MRQSDLNRETLPRWKGKGEDGNGPEVADLAQLVQMINLGRTIAVLPYSLADLMQSGLTLVPVTDAPVSILAVAWLTHDCRSSVGEFVAAALTITRGNKARLNSDPAQVRSANVP